MPLDLDAIARAVKQVESSGGIDKRSRYEPGFERRYGKTWVSQGDRAFRQTMLKQFGPKVVYASHGPYQIMYPVAVELGFRGTPDQLAEETTNRQYFEKKFMRDYRATKGSIEKTLLRYNGGGDPTYPQRVLQHLNQSAAPVLKQHSALPTPGGAMPTLKEMQLDGPEVHEKIVAQVYRMDQNSQKMGLGPLSPEDMSLAYGNIKRGVAQMVGQPRQPLASAPPSSVAPAALGSAPPIQGNRLGGSYA